MRVGRAIKWSVLIVGLLLIGIAAAAYFMASAVPDAYRPAQLTPDQRQQATRDFYRFVVQDINNAAQDVKPFSWSVSEQKLNEYLASMDEIAAAVPGGKPGQATEAMASAGLRGPAVDLSPGEITLMVESTEYGKIISLDMSVSMRDDGRMQVDFAGARVGVMDVPLSFVREELGSLTGRLAGKLRSDPDGGERSGLSPTDVGAALGVLLSRVGKEPFVPEAEIDGRYIRVDRVGITDDALEIHVVREPL